MASPQKLVRRFFSAPMGAVYALECGIGWLTEPTVVCCRRQPISPFSELGSGSRRRNLIGPDLETDQRIGAEGVGYRHVGGVSALRDEDAADTRRVVAWIERVPSPAEIGFEPAGKIHRTKGLLHTDVAEVAGTVARRNVHAAAEGDGKVRVVPANAPGVVEDVEGRLCCTGVLVAEGDVAVDEIADGLDPVPTQGRLAKQVPGRFRQSVGLAVAAAKEKRQGFGGQVLNRVLTGPRRRNVGPPSIIDDAVGPQAEPASGRDEAAAPVAEDIAIGEDWHRWGGHQMIGDDDV
jgi:hypothetical protein